MACALASAASAPAAAAPPTPLLLAEVEVAAVPSPSSARSETREERQSRHIGRTWGWVLVSMGGTAGFFAVGTSVLMLANKGIRDGNCDAAKVCSQSGLDANAQLGSLAGWNVGAWSFAAAGLGLGAYLLLTHPTDRATGTELRVVPNGSGASFSLRTAF